MRKLIEKVRHSPRLHHGVHGCALFAHVSYCASVAVEGHGIYAISAAVLGVAVIGESLFNGGKGE